MPRSRNSSALKKLQAEWYSRLKENGFEDIEDKRERLKSYDRRTVAFENRDSIRDFFLALDAFLNHEPEIKILHRQILELYSQGIYIKEIARRVNRSEPRIRQIIDHYKKRILYRFSTGV